MFRLFGEKSFFKHETGAQQARAGMEYLKPSAVGNVRVKEVSFIERLRAVAGQGNPQATFVNRENNRSFSTGDVERSKLASPSSLQLVFQRLQYVDDSTQTRISPLLQQRVTNLALRVVRQTERVERRTPGTPATVVTRPTAATGQQRVTTPVFSTEHSAESMSGVFDQPMGAWTGKSFARMPDMDQITEQVMRRIDDRVIAMRERMGHV